MSYSKKKRQLQEEKEARLNKIPEKETRSVIKQSKAFVRKVSYSYGIRLTVLKRKKLVWLGSFKDHCGPLQLSTTA